MACAGPWVGRERRDLRALRHQQAWGQLMAWVLEVQAWQRAAWPRPGQEAAEVPVWEQGCGP